MRRKNAYLPYLFIFFLIACLGSLGAGIGHIYSTKVEQMLASSLNSEGKWTSLTFADDTTQTTTATFTTTPTKFFIIENLASTDDNFEMFHFPDAVTIDSLGAHCRGDCSSLADIRLEDRSGNVMTHTTPTVTTGTSLTTYISVTANNDLSAGEGLAFDVTNTPGGADTYTLSITYSLQ